MATTENILDLGPQALRSRLHDEYKQHDLALREFLRPYNNQRRIVTVRDLRRSSEAVARQRVRVPQSIQNHLQRQIDKRSQVRQSLLAEIRQQQASQPANGGQSNTEAYIDSGHDYYFRTLLRIRDVWDGLDPTASTNVAPSDGPQPDTSINVEGNIRPNANLDDIDRLSIITSFLASIHETFAQVRTECNALIAGRLNLVCFGSKMTMLYTHLRQEVQIILQDPDKQEIVDTLMPAALTNDSSWRPVGDGNFQLLQKIADWHNTNASMDQINQEVDALRCDENSPGYFTYAIARYARRIYQNVLLFQDAGYRKYSSPFIHDLRNSLGTRHTVPRVVLAAGLAMMHTMLDVGRGRLADDFILTDSLMQVLKSVQLARRGALTSFRTRPHGSPDTSALGHCNDLLSMIGRVTNIEFADVWTVSHIYLAYLRDNHESLFRFSYDPASEGSILKLLFILRNVELVGGVVKDKVMHRFMNITLRAFCASVSVGMPNTVAELAALWDLLTQRRPRTRRGQRAVDFVAMRDRMFDPRFGFHAAFANNSYSITLEQMDTLATHLGVPPPRSLSDKLALVEKADRKQRLMYIEADNFGYWSHDFLEIFMQEFGSLRFSTTHSGTSFTPLSINTTSTSEITRLTRRVTSFLSALHRCIIWEWPEINEMPAKMLCAMPWFWLADDILMDLLPNELASQLANNPDLDRDTLWSQVSINSIDAKMGSTEYDNYCHENANQWLLQWRDTGRHPQSTKMKYLGVLHLADQTSEPTDEEMRRYSLIGHALRKRIGLFNTNVHSIAWLAHEYQRRLGHGDRRAVSIMT